MQNSSTAFGRIIRQGRKQVLQTSVPCLAGVICGVGRTMKKKRAIEPSRPEPRAAAPPASEPAEAPAEPQAESAGSAVEDLNLFLSGERTLRSDVLDRLALAVEFTKGLQAAVQPPEHKS